MLPIIHYCFLHHHLPEERQKLSFILHPFISLLSPQFLCEPCQTLAIDVKIHDLRVCFAPNDPLASLTALLTTA